MCKTQTKHKIWQLKFKCVADVMLYAEWEIWFTLKEVIYILNIEKHKTPSEWIPTELHVYACSTTYDLIWTLGADISFHSLYNMPSDDGVMIHRQYNKLLSGSLSLK